MKGLVMLAALTLQLLAMEAHGQTPSREDLRRTVVHMSALARELDGKLAGTQGQLSQANSALARARQQLDAANGRLAVLNADIARLDAWGKDQQALKNDALAAAAKYERQLGDTRKQLAEALARYHWLKFLCASIAGALAAFVALRLSGPLQLTPLYLAAAVAAAFAGGFALIFLTL